MKKSILKNMSTIALVASLFTGQNLYANSHDILSKRQNKMVRGYSKLKKKADKDGLVRVIVKLKDRAPEGSSALSQSQRFNSSVGALERKGIRAKKRFHKLNMAVYSVSPGQLDKLLDDDAVEKVQEDLLSKTNLYTALPFIGADVTRARGQNGTGQAVVIFDSGVDDTHPAFPGSVVEEACFSSTFAGENSVTLCPNGLEEQFGPGAGVDCSATGITGCDHGTHVAGIAAANDSRGVWGVASESNIIAVQVFSEFNKFAPGCQIAGQAPIEKCIRTWNSDQIAAMNWVLHEAVTPNIAAINMSLGSGYYTAPCDGDLRAIAITQLKSAGIATVISSGNASYTDGVGAPGCISDAITVGSVGVFGSSADRVSTFSNSAAMVDLLAPGERIFSSIPGANYDDKYGTSMAAPFVAGAFAVLKQVFPNASVDELEQLLESTGADVIDLKNGMHFPRLDIEAATNVGVPTNTFIDARDAQVYTYTTIGDQTWMAENLNYSAGNTVGYCSGQTNTQNSATCDTYGRLYDWNMAMNGAQPSSTVPSNVQGLCPEDWHLPSDGEWQQLVDYVDANNGQEGVAASLKSESHWWGMPGSNMFGFGALPGGFGGSGGSNYYNSLTKYGLHWSTTMNGSKALRRDMRYNTHDVSVDNSGTSWMVSVRCLKNQKFIDARDGQAYKKVTIGEQTWMAENLNYSADNTIGYCSGQTNTQNAATCDTYGRLYDWNMAMNGDPASAAVPSTSQGICPAGWHMPSDGEWQQLVDYVDANNGQEGVAKSLKSGSHWLVKSASDMFGFGALPGGFGSSGGSNYYGSLTKYGLHWSATENGPQALRRDMRYTDDNVSTDNSDKDWMVSARCVED
ncbi:MAG: S8 family serine peptidase [Fibrobacterales bacterium]